MSDEREGRRVGPSLSIKRSFFQNAGFLNSMFSGNHFSFKSKFFLYIYIMSYQLVKGYNHLRRDSEETTIPQICLDTQIVTTSLSFPLAWHQDTLILGHKWAHHKATAQVRYHQAIVYLEAALGEIDTQVGTTQGLSRVLITLYLEAARSSRRN